MTVIPLGAGLPRRSSHLPANLSEPLIARRDCACSIRLFGVAPGGGYRVSPAVSFCATNSQLAPLVGRKDTATRLCGPIPRLRRRQAFDYYVRPLAVTLLYGARTFLSASCDAQRPPGQLHQPILAPGPPVAAPHCRSACSGQTGIGLFPLALVALRGLVFAAAVFLPAALLLRFLALSAPRAEMLHIVVVALVFVVRNPARNAQHRQR